MAVSKRYSRLKIAFEEDSAAPPTPGSSAKKTPSKGTGQRKDDEEDTPTKTPKTPKRKRAATSKTIKITKTDDEDDASKSKRAKATPKSKPKPKHGFRASEHKESSVQAAVKGEPEEDEGDVFLDASETPTAAFGPGMYTRGESEEVCKSNLLLPGRLDTSGANGSSARLQILGGIRSGTGYG